MPKTNMKTSNRWDTRTLVTMALLAAIGAALSFIELPFIALSFLKYDASNVPALVGGFVFGAGPGFVIGLIIAIIHALFTGDWWGCLMNIAAVAGAVIPSALIYKRHHTFKGALVGLIVGIVVNIIVLTLMNILIDPIYYGVDRPTILAMILPVIVPFNLMKGGINAALTLLVYKPISNIVRPKRELGAADEVVDESDNLR